MAPSRNYHVVPRGGEWLVQTEGAPASRSFADREAALREARRLAAQAGGSLYIHGEDGRIQEERPGGLDPFPPLR
jgi:hypothetical protein